jgi:hypothetical protein
MLVIAVGVIFYSVSFLSFASNTTVLKERMKEVEAQRLAVNLAYIINTVARNPGMVINVTLPGEVGGKAYDIMIRRDLLVVTVGEDSYPAKLTTFSITVWDKNFSQIGNTGSGLYVR